MTDPHPDRKWRTEHSPWDRSAYCDECDWTGVDMDDVYEHVQQTLHRVNHLMSLHSLTWLEPK